MRKILTYIVLISYLLTSNHALIRDYGFSAVAEASIMEPDTISNLVFHYDAQDTDWDGNPANEPTDGSNLTTWIDKENSFNATQVTAAKRPIYRSSGINGLPALEFDGGDDVYNVDNQNLINTATYNEKSFAAVFRTGPDINTFQTIYEQGGTIRWYSFIIHNGRIYAGIWNTAEWDTWNQFKSVDLWVAQANSNYFAMIVQDSTSGVDSENTLAIYLNGNLVSFVDHVDPQTPHGWLVGIWAVRNDTVRASDNLPISLWEWNYFSGHIGELISWNHALNTDEILWTHSYLSDRWWVTILREITPVEQITTDTNPSYTFSTNRSGTLVYWGSCNSTTTSASFWDNTITFDSNGAGWPLSEGNFNDCTISLTDTFWNTTILNVSPFTVVVDTTGTGIIAPSALPNLVLHYDAQNTDGDENPANEPADWSNLWTWIDLAGVSNATQWNATGTPDYITSGINGLPSLEFNGTSDFYDVANAGLINTNALFDQKSFAAVFETGPDVTTFQNIYEQGGGARWYSFVIDDWRIYAWVWNNNEWDPGEQYKSVDLWVAEPNTVYFSMIVQDSDNGDDFSNRLLIYLNGVLSSFQDHTDPQRSHGGTIALWKVSGNSVRASDNVAVWDGSFFGGRVGEFLSWNHALSYSEVQWIQNYFSDRWDIAIFTESQSITSPTTNRNPLYRFITNREGTLSYGGGCNSTTTTAVIWENTIVFDSDGAGWQLTNGVYDTCTITLTETGWETHVLSVTPFTIESAMIELTEVTPVPTPTTDTTPDYTFNSPITWDIFFQGSCSSATTSAAVWNNTITLNALPNGTFIDCFIKVKNIFEETPFLHISNFTINADITAPIITATTPENDDIIPIWNNLSLDFSYNDAGSWVNTGSISLILQKWDGVSSYWSDLFWTNVSIDSITESDSNYTANWLDFGRYRAQFSMADVAGNIQNEEIIFYIDEIEFIVSTGSLDIGSLETWTATFSDEEITITVRTVWTQFNVLMNKNIDMENDNGDEIIDWDGSMWFGYEKDSFVWDITAIWVNQPIGSEVKNLNTNGDKNTYTYTIKCWALVEQLQASGAYETNLWFTINLSY